MGATTILALVACGITLIYLYVMGMCYLCDLYTQKQEKKRKEAEKQRKELLRLAYEETEMRRKQEVVRRKEIARARKKRGLVTADTLARKHAPPGQASEARA